MLELVRSSLEPKHSWPWIRRWVGLVECTHTRGKGSMSLANRPFGVVEWLPQPRT